MTMSLPSDDIMKEMARLAVEQTTELMAKMAEELADNPCTRDCDGPSALRAFAKSIRGANFRTFATPNQERPQ